MKKRLISGIILPLVVLITILVSATLVFAWGQSTHTFTTEVSHDLENRYLASYNARMGSIVPDFFWYLRDLGLINDAMAYKLHGKTEEYTVSDDTTYFYDIAKSQLRPWNYMLRYFTQGIRSHVYADIRAHNTTDGYVEGEDMWCDILEGLTGEDRETLHLAIEFAVDSLLVHNYGLQFADILFSYRQANFLEKVVKKAFNENFKNIDFDVSLEFKKYLALMRALEKAAKLYAPYLIKGEVDEAFLEILDSSEFLDAQQKLSNDSLDNYLKVLMILLNYPEEIYDTITTDGKHWENNALQDIIDFCGP